jgi:hypothetical protein
MFTDDGLDRVFLALVSFGVSLVLAIAFVLGYLLGKS